MPPAAPAPGSRIGPYEVVAPLRAGGMASLYLGHRAGPGGFSRPVAIKIVHAHLAKDASFVRMFLDEARLCARISDPNVVHVEELGEADGVLYLAMEYVHGTSLGNLLSRLGQTGRVFAPEVACAIAMRVADGLHAAHELRGDDGAPLEVVHRDVSPQNVLVSRAGHVKLIDFGVAKARGRIQETEAGSLKGKLRYMSPEQAWGETIDRRTDVYALGVVLWEMLTQSRLFSGENEMIVLERVRHPHVPRPSSITSAVSPELDEVVLSALAVDPDARYPTTQALRRAIATACPDAVRVQPEDLAALVVELAGDELAEEHALLGAFASAGPASEIAEEKQKTVLDRLTREVPADRAHLSMEGAPEERTREVRHVLASTRVTSPRTSTPLTSAAALPGSTPNGARSRPRVVLAALGASALIALTSGGVWLGTRSAEEAPPASRVVVVAPPSPPGVCDAARRFRGEEGVRASLELDTREAPATFMLPGVRNEEVPAAPQVLVEYVVPGTGPHALDVSTANAGTDPLFDTLVAVFRGACDERRSDDGPDVAFDDFAREFRARGSIAVDGGETLTLVITGFGGDLSNRVDRGLVQVDLTPHVSTLPVLTEVAVFVAENEVLVTTSGTDAEGDAIGVSVRLFDADDQPIEVAVSPALDPRTRTEEGPVARVTTIQEAFERPVLGAREFSERARIVLVDDDAARIRLAHRAEVALVDAPGRVGATRSLEVVHGEISGPGERCDGTHACASELVCGARGRCAPAPRRLMACEDAAAIELVPTELDGRAASAQSTLDPGPGYFTAQCLPQWTGGREDVYRVSVPRGRWDLVATTDSEGTAGESRRNPDTIVYVRRDCLDAAPESAPASWCNDDIAPGEGIDANQRSRVEIRDLSAGELFVFVELWGGALPDGSGERYELDVRLRPVVARGAACDPAGIEVRCADGACDGATSRCVATATAPGGVLE